MSSKNMIAIVGRDRKEIDRLIAGFFAGGDACNNNVARMRPSIAHIFRQKNSRCFCVQRYPKFLEDHTIAQNWGLPLWDLARQDIDEWRWLQDEARSIMSRYSELSTQAYPAELDDVTRIAAQFCQAHILLPDVLLLDAVFSDWHHSDRDKVFSMLRDYLARHPLRPVVHLDVVPPPDELHFQRVEMAEA